MSIMETKKVESLLQQILPNYTFLKPIGHHHLKRHYVYEVIQNKKYVVKFYGKQNKWNREVSALRILNNQKIITPTIIDYGVIEDIEYVVMDFIECEIMEEQVLSQKEINDILYLAGADLAKLHKENQYSKFGILNSDLTFKYQFDTWKEYYIYEVKRHLNNINRFTHEEIELIDYAKEELFQLIDEYQFQGYGHLVHNDYSQRNIMIKDKKYLGILDFEQSCITDRYRELIMIQYHLEKYGKEAFYEFIKGYLTNLDIDFTYYDNVKKMYMLHYGLAIVSWSKEVDLAHYQEGISLIKQYKTTIKK